MESGSGQDDVTELLGAWGRGDRQALDRLMPLVHGELRRIGRGHLAHERPDHTLQATALVHETYLALCRQARPPAACRAQLFGVASLLMRRILFRHAERRSAAKRNGGHAEASAAPQDQSAQADVLAIDQALATLHQVDPRQARIVALRFFAGFSVTETADRLGISTATVKRDWRMARAWLRAALLDTDDVMAAGAHCDAG